MIKVILFTTCLLIVLLVIWVFDEMWGEEPPERRERAGRDTPPPPPVKFGDMLILMGSEGENPPRLDIRREVAEQLGCEDDKPKNKEGDDSEE